ncbi:MAG: NUDIX hydrolase [Gammaproteobacteria bacterium]|nr:MAG: NUDIX hydrolase [Gammaproteobacteria bacterium]
MSELHLTVAAVVERDGRFLCVEEHVEGRLVINQPAGHVENGESLTEAAIRETLEETGWRVQIEALLRLYRWRHPANGCTYFRAAFRARPLDFDPHRPLDTGIERALWLTPAELAAQVERLRSPMVLQCVEDHLARRAYPLDLLADL